MKVPLEGRDTTRNYDNISIDRVDSSKGYIEGNIVLCKLIINQMKSDLVLDNFLNICKNIVDYNGKNK